MVGCIFIGFRKIWHGEVRYMITLILKTKTVNMRTLKYTLVFGIFFLLFLTSVKSSNLINFGDSPIVMTSGLTNRVSHISVYYDPITAFWYVAWSSSNVPECWLSKWNRDFTVKMIDWIKEVDEAGNVICDISENYYNASELYMVSTIDGTSTEIRFMNISKSDLTISGGVVDKIIKDCSQCTGFTTAGSGKSSDISGMEQSTNTWVASCSGATGHYVFYTFPYYNNVSYCPFVPSSYAPLSPGSYQHDLSHVYNIMFPDEYWSSFLAYYNSTWSLILQRMAFDTDFTWKTSDRISLQTESVYIKTSFYNPYTKQYYILYRNGTNDANFRIKLLNPSDVIGMNSFIVAGTQDLNMTPYKNTNAGLIGNDLINTTKLYWENSTNSKYWMFWSEYNNTHSYIYAMAESLTCTCTDWVNGECASSNSRYQRRTCVPDNCEEEIQSIDDSSCTNEFIANYENVTYQSTCEKKLVKSGWFGWSTVMGCDVCSAILTIPQNCTAPIITEAKGWQIIDNGGGNSALFTNGNHSINAMTPVWNDSSSTIGIWNCSSGWGSQVIHNYNDYYGGQTISAKFTGCVDGECVYSLTNLGGIKEWSIHGLLKVTCKQACTGFWKCADDITSYYKDIDCQPKNYTICSLGCNKDNGKCNIGGEITIEKQKQIDKCSLLDPLSYISCLASNTFSDVILTAFSIGVAGVVMIISTHQTKSWQLGISLGLLVCTIFWKLGWLDSWVLLLWGLSVALLIAQTITKQIKGGSI